MINSDEDMLFRCISMINFSRIDPCKSVNDLGFSLVYEAETLPETGNRSDDVWESAHSLTNTMLVLSHSRWYVTSPLTHKWYVRALWYVMSLAGM